MKAARNRVAQNEAKPRLAPGEMTQQAPPGFALKAPAFYVGWAAPEVPRWWHSANLIGLICDPEAPLEHGCRVVVQVDAHHTGPPLPYFEGTVLTKHPATAKTIDIRLTMGLAERRREKRHVARVIYSVHGEQPKEDA